MLMGIKEIQEIIPHRHPFLLIDFIALRSWSQASEP